MHLQFFTIPIHGGAEAAAALNQFLSSHRIIAIDRHFVPDGPNSAWCLCVSSVGADDARAAVPGKRPSKLDYRELLNQQDFAVFARLRSLRKQLAEAEGVPAYALFTNEQLAAMVQRPITSLADLQTIDGVGEARAAKYGTPFLALLRASATNPTGEQSPPP